MNMKKIIALSAILVVSTAYSFAQGTVSFNNRNTGVGIDARVFLMDGTGAGAGYTAELLAGTSVDNLTVVGTTDFRTSSAAAQGYVNAVTVTIDGIAPGADAVLVMRAYNGASYDSSSEFGESLPITVALGGVGVPPGPSADMIGLQGFTLVPEPSTIALGVLGAAGLLLLRRRK